MTLITSVCAVPDKCLQCKKKKCRNIPHAERQCCDVKRFHGVNSAFHGEALIEGCSVVVCVSVCVCASVCVCVRLSLHCFSFFFFSCSTISTLYIFFLPPLSRCIWGWRITFSLKK